MLFFEARRYPLTFAAAKSWVRAYKEKQTKGLLMREARAADLPVCAMPIELRTAHYHADKEPIAIWVVHAREKIRPADARQSSGFC